MARKYRRNLIVGAVGLLVVLGLTACGSSLDEETPRDAAVWLADSPSSWNRVVDSALGGVGEQQMTSVTVFDAGIIAGGFETIDGDRDARVWISSNGSSWDKIIDPDFDGPGEQTIWTIATTEHGFVAGGTTGESTDADAALWYSRDGRDWHQVPSDPSFQGPGHQVVLTVTTYQDRIFAAGRNYLDAAVWVSDDGVVWTPIEEPSFGGEGEQAIWEMETTTWGLVAVGEDDRDASAWILDEDGWSQLQHPSFGGDGHQVMQDLVSMEAGLLVVGGVYEYDEIYFLGRGLRGHIDALAWTSPDIQEWSRVHDEAVLGGRGHQVLEQVIVWDSTVIGVGYDLAGRGNVIEGLAAHGSGLDVDAAVWLSEDGAHWDRVTDSDLGGEDWQDMWDVAVIPDVGLVAVGGDDLGSPSNE